MTLRRVGVARCMARFRVSSGVSVGIAAENVIIKASDPISFTASLVRPATKIMALVFRVPSGCAVNALLSPQIEYYHHHCPPSCGINRNGRYRNNIHRAAEWIPNDSTLSGRAIYDQIYEHYLYHYCPYRFCAHISSIYAVSPLPSPHCSVLRST